MADIAAGDVTYSILNQRKTSGSRNSNRVRISFGDSSLTVPANGIPLSKRKMGCPTIIESMVVVDQGVSGYRFQYDQSTEKLVVIQSPAHAHALKIIGGRSAAGTAATAYYATDIFGKEAATDTTITAADSATKGGVLASAALAGSEASAVAIAAQIIEVEVIGW